LESVVDLKLNANRISRFLTAAVFFVLATSPGFAQSTTQASALKRVGPGDILRLRIWREPDMSGDFEVATNGIAVLPRLGDVDVSKIPADSLQPLLTQKYRVYLNNPSIEVLLLRRVTITGAVKTPGVYPLEPTMTIGDALALAGGPASDGKRDVVEIRRAGQRIAADLRTNDVLADSPVQSGDQLYVPSKPWLERNTWLISATISFTAIIVAQIVAHH
jgi:protein involved in polysaccharide export with SLBB domain